MNAILSVWTFLWLMLALFCLGLLFRTVDAIKRPRVWTVFLFVWNVFVVLWILKLLW